MTLFIIFSLLRSLLYHHCLLPPSVKGQASQGFIGFIFILIFGAHDTQFILLIYVCFQGQYLWKHFALFLFII